MFWSWPEQWESKESTCWNTGFAFFCDKHHYLMRLRFWVEYEDKCDPYVKVITAAATCLGMAISAYIWTISSQAGVKRPMIQDAYSFWIKQHS